MERFKEWYGGKRVDELFKGREDSKYTLERLTRLEWTLNDVIDWIKEHEKHKHVGYVLTEHERELRQEALDVERQIQKRLDEYETKGDPAPK